VFVDSFDLGGEKLKIFRSRSGVLVPFFIFLMLLSPLYSQTQGDPDGGQTLEPIEETQDTSPILSFGVNESEIILGEAIEPITPNGGSSVFVVLRMVLVLALAALAIYGVVFFIKRLAKPQESRDPNLKVLARVPLGNDAFAAVISVGAKAWLVAGGSGSTNLISEIDEPEALETMLIEDAQKTAGTGLRRFFDFRSLLRKPGLKTQGVKTPGASHSEGLTETRSLVEGLREQRERLRGL